MIRFLLQLSYAVNFFSGYLKGLSQKPVLIIDGGFSGEASKAWFQDRFLKNRPAGCLQPLEAIFLMAQK
jgi:hypothetical protein